MSTSDRKEGATCKVDVKKIVDVKKMVEDSQESKVKSNSCASYCQQTAIVTN